MKLIGITGLAGAGKDTFARYLQTELLNRGVQSRIDSFAAPIRALSERVCLDPRNRETKETPQVKTWSYFTDDLGHAMQEVLTGCKAAFVQAMVDATIAAIAPLKQGEHLTISPRQFLQLVGTEAGRRLGPDLWVDLLRGRNEGYDGMVLIPDCRFENEVLPCAAILNVIRPGLIAMNHASERLAARLASFDPIQVDIPVRHIRNYGDTEELRKQAHSMAHHLTANRMLDL